MVPTGVALIVFSQGTQRILTVKELRDKPSVRKKAGMFSFPIETVKNGESFHRAVQRLMKEELGRVINGKVRFFCDPFTIIPGTQTAAASINVPSEFDFTPHDDDIAPHGWLLIPELMRDDAFVRVETRPILEKFITLL